MRILFLSNFYPPIRAGGYGQLCEEVAKELRSRNHDVRILTSCYQQEMAPTSEEGVLRRLHLEGNLFYYRPIDFFFNWKRRQRQNLQMLRQIMSEFVPDLTVVWGMWALSKAIPALAEELMPFRVIYYLADYWPTELDMHRTYWYRPARHRFMHIPKRVLGRLATSILDSEHIPSLQFRHVLTVSAALRNILVSRGLPIDHARVIHNGIAAKEFLTPPKTLSSRSTTDQEQLKLLYAGQIVPHKGVHSVIAAMDLLVNEYGLDRVFLTILGSGHPDYEASLRAQVKTRHLNDHVSFRKPVARKEMPTILHQFDALVFPSIYPEPLARITQEAMAAGLVVIGTTTGGTKELLVDGLNGLAFGAEDVTELAAQIARIRLDPDLRDCLATAARNTIIEHFTLERMVNDFEDYLYNVRNSEQPKVSLKGDGCEFFL